MENFEPLTPLLQRFVSSGTAGCACRVVLRGETRYDGYFGYADLENEKPVAADTIYRICSMTKIVTCVSALRLFERGCFLLTDPLEEYLPEFCNPQVYRRAPDGTSEVVPAARSIRIADLFTMASGLTYANDDSETGRGVARAIAGLQREEAQGGRFDLRAFSRELGKIPLAFDPGTRWRYGFSHDILAALVEVVSGKEFARFLKEELFEPLGMPDTFFDVPESKRDRLAKTYDYLPEGRFAENTTAEASLRPGAAFQSGGGGLYSTVPDYMRFAQMLLRGGELDGERILGRKTVALMAADHLSPAQRADFDWPVLAGYGYGLGVRVMTDPPAGCCNGSAGEFGWNGLFGSWVLMDPAEELAAVYMQQTLPHRDVAHQLRLRAAIYAAL